MTTRSEVTDPLGHTTVTKRNPYGLVTERVFPDGTRETTTYAGNTSRDEAGSFPVTQVDEVGPTEFTASYSYDAAGNVARVRGARGDEFHYRYDAANRLVERRWQLGSDETNAITTTYSYDAGWKLRTVSRDGTVQQRFGYDDAGRVTRVERGGRTVELGYDVDDHLTEWTDTGAGASVSDAFDGRG